MVSANVFPTSSPQLITSLAVRAHCVGYMKAGIDEFEVNTGRWDTQKRHQNLHTFVCTSECDRVSEWNTNVNRAWATFLLLWLNGLASRKHCFVIASGGADDDDDVVVDIETQHLFEYFSAEPALS